MKPFIYHSSEHQFPVNHLKNEVEKSETNLPTGRKITGSYPKKMAVLHRWGISLRRSIEIVDFAGYSGKLLRNAAIFLVRSVRVILLAFRHWLAPLYNKGVGLYYRFLEIAAGYLDVFFHFMDSFLFMDEAALQPAFATQGSLPLQNRQFAAEQHHTVKFAARHQVASAVNANESVEKNLDNFSGHYKATGRRLRLTILPKIKLPLKTSNADVLPPRQHFFYPVGEYLQLIFARCNNLFRLNPKHLNAGMKQHFKPAFKAAN